jgi:hypothetical protein
MRAFLITAPRWILCAVYGLPFGAIWTGGILWDNQAGSIQIIAFGLVGGLLFGVLMMFATEKQRREVRGVIGAVRPEEVSTVCRAVRGGPVPADPEIRAAAWRLASHDSAEAKLRLFVAIPATVLVIAGTTAQADYSPLYFGLSVLSVLTLAWQLYWTRHLKQRVALLADS